MIKLNDTVQPTLDALRRTDHRKYVEALNSVIDATTPQHGERAAVPWSKSGREVEWRKQEERRLVRLCRAAARDAMRRLHI
jgi:hypothetical protein